MSAALEELIAILQLEPIEADVYRGRGSHGDGADGTYGGHLLGQAVAAASNTVDRERRIHSLHAYFLRPGRPGQPLDYHVQAIRDGRSFNTRRVSASQAGKSVFELSCSFTNPASGPVFEAQPPADLQTLPAPESLPRYHELMGSQDPVPLPAEWALREHGVDVRVVNAPWSPNGPSSDHGIRMWIRANGRLPDDPKLHDAVLAYQSDESICDNVLVPFGVTWGTPDVFCVSLDHAMWFHRPVDLNRWHFVEQRPLAYARERGVAGAEVWTEDGALVASFRQEVLLRLPPK